MAGPFRPRLLDAVRQPWVAGVFGVALVGRLGFTLLVDEPLLYTHQYTYFTNALRIAEHPSPLHHVLTSDEWRTWNQHWTIAPLYHLFAASVFFVFGPHLLPLRLLQCLLDSTAAVGVAALGRRVAGPRGAWAGVAYALYWPAVEMTSSTMTENVHTALLVAGVALLVREADAPGRRLAFAAGAVLGLAALARSVTTGFLGLAALWRLRPGGFQRGLPFAALIAAGGASIILPWAARNVFLIGEPVLIETAAFENLWWANHFVDGARFARQEQIIRGQETPAAKRATALRFALRGVRRHPDLFVEKIRANFWHFLRPEGLHNLLRIERSQEGWRHGASLAFDDLILLLAVPPFLVFLIAGRPSPARAMIAVWTAYYLLMIVVVFHNEIRYRSAFVPFAFAGAAGGVAPLLDRASPRRWLAAWGALAVGIWIVGSAAGLFAAPAWRAWTAARALRPALAAVDGSRLDEAERLAVAAAREDPTSPRPWLEYGRRLAFAGHVEQALAAYRRAGPLSTPASWTSRIALARFLPELEASDEAAAARRVVDRLSWDTDPWLVLEIAWAELPPPRADEILLAQGDYGAVRGFLHPRGLDPDLSRHRLEWNKYEQLGDVLPPPGPHRWSRGRAWLRLVPTQVAHAYDITLEMGAPFPSRLTAPTVVVRAVGAEPIQFTLTGQVLPYTFRAPAPLAGQPLVVRLDAPTWCRPGEPADQGVRVDRMTVTPVR
jgi:hypothetical protein